VRLIPQWWFRRTRVCRRLTQVLDTFHGRLERTPASDWRDYASWLLEQARKRVGEQDPDGAWYCLHQAMRQEIEHLGGQKLLNHESMLSSEAGKIDSAWRTRAIEVLLKKSPPDEASRAVVVAKTQELLDDYYETQYYKSGLVRGQMTNLVVISLFALAMLLGFTAPGQQTGCCTSAATGPCRA